MAVVFCMAAPCMLRADADADCKSITALDAGPQGKATTRDVALQLTLQHFAQQEKALKAFIVAYPGDPRGLDARLRLAHIYAVRSDLEGDPKLYAIARKMLDDLMASPATPKG